jgi:tRNA(His) guanylyltransferase
MAKSQYEYVKRFETEDPLLPNCFIVVRVDGRAFHRFVADHSYVRPNDPRGLGIMRRAAQAVMAEFRGDIVVAYGESDEFSFVFRRSTTLYGRRAAKLCSYVVSLFSAAFVFHWPGCFGSDTPLRYPPFFDARAVCYPTVRNVRDYLSWRQADCHVNNLYNTAFWALVNMGGMTPAEAEKALLGTDAAAKNELLFSRFGINYAKLPEEFRKGTTLAWSDSGESPLPEVLFVDIIGNEFWDRRPGLLQHD